MTNSLPLLKFATTIWTDIRTFTTYHDATNINEVERFAQVWRMPHEKLLGIDTSLVSHFPILKGTAK